MVFVLLRRDAPKAVAEGNKTRIRVESSRDPSSFRFSRVFYIIHATFYSRFLLDAWLLVKGNYFCPITNSIKVKVCLPSFVGKSFFSFPHPLLSPFLVFPIFPLDFSFPLFFSPLLFLFSSFLIIWPTERQMNYLERRVEQDLL